MQTPSTILNLFVILGFLTLLLICVIIIISIWLQWYPNFCNPEVADENFRLTLRQRPSLHDSCGMIHDSMSMTSYVRCRLLCKAKWLCSLFESTDIVGYCKAEYDYAPRELNHLSIKTGDEIAILSKAGEAKGWWKGYLRGKVCDVFHHFLEYSHREWFEGGERFSNHSRE